MKKRKEKREKVVQLTGVFGKKKERVEQCTWRENSTNNGGILHQERNNHPLRQFAPPFLG